MSKLGTIFAIAALGALSGCGPVVYRDRIQQVKVPMPQPCASVRPSSPVTLKARTPDWKDMDVRQKAAATGEWALELLGYGQHLNAATAACP